MTTEAPTAEPMPRRLWVALAVVALIAAAVRIGFHESMRANDPLQGAPRLDTAAYDADMRALLGTGPATAPVPLRPPGYTWLLAAISAAGGGEKAVTHTQAAIDGVSTVLLGRLAWLAMQSVGWSVTGGLFFAAQPAFIYFSGERLETTWMVFWVLLHLTALQAALAANRRRAWFGAGATLGMATLIRPNVLLWLPFLLAGVWRRSGKPTALVAAAGAVLVIAPITIKNAVSSGELVVVSPNGGVNLWLGNVPEQKLAKRIPYYEHLPGPLADWQWQQLYARPEADGATTDAQRDRWFWGQALGEMVSHPLRTARLMALKTVAFFDRVDMSNNRDVYRAGSPFTYFYGWLVAWAVLVPAALVGLWSQWKRPDRQARWVAAFLAIGALSVILFFVSSRHRTPFLPALLLLALPGFRAFIDTFRKREYDSRVIVLMLVGAFAPAHDWFGHRELYRDYEIDPVSASQLWRRLGNTEEAMAALQRAIDREPRDAYAWSDRASLLIDQGQFVLAEPTAVQAIQLDPTSARAHNLLGLCKFHLEQPGAALRSFESAVQHEANYAIGWMNRGRALHALDRVEEARESFNRAMSLFAPGDPNSEMLQRYLDSLDEF